MFTHKRAFKLILKIVLGLTAVLLLMYSVMSLLDNNKAKTFQSIFLESGHSNNSIVILFWNGFFDDNRWTLPADTLNVQCPLINCILTNRHEYLPSIVDYAAIVFHTARPFPLFNGRPRQRAVHQWYIFSQLESPAHTWHNFYEESEFYNLTMSYRLDSDIVWSYNSIRDSATNQVVAPVLKPQWRKVDATWTQSDSNLSVSIKRKKKLAVWFVSNCEVPSKRERLVKRLQAHLNTGIDVYGKCGPLRCERSNSSCYEILDTDYKFYLSFENSLCVDYVTEKFYNALQRHIVPVVYGGANYSNFAPPHSYIDVQDFKNVSELAAHLIYLDKNPLEYAKYFWWRRHYTIMSFDGGLQTIPYCSLCERVTSHPAMRRLQIYEDINAFWTYNACYAVPRIQF